MPVAVAGLVYVTGLPIPGFDGRSAELLTVYALSIGMLVLGALGTASGTAFFARQQSAALAKLASWAFTIGVVVKVGLFLVFGVYGLALGVSLYFTLSYGLQWNALSKMRQPAVAVL